MNEKLTIQDLTKLLAAKHGMTEQDAETFVKEFFLLIEQALESDRCVKINGLGTFKLIEVDNRESVNINTGERFQIKGHNKISFIPDSNVREIINKPFSHFESVVLNENTVLDDTPLEDSDDVEEKEEEADGAPVEQPDENRAAPDVEKTEPEKKIAAKEEKPVEMPPQSPEPKACVAETKVVEKAVEAPRPVEAPAAQGKKTTLYLAITILAAVLLCGGAIFYMYYPDLFQAEEETIEMPSIEEPMQMPADTIVEKDTLVTDSIARMNVAAKDNTAPQTAAAENNTSPKVYSESVKYIITGTKTTHTMKEGESLIKVALRYYGNKAMWTYIVKHNQGTIKNPDNVPYGTVIKIPELSEK